jgi:hypothetical protein
VITAIRAQDTLLYAAQRYYGGWRRALAAAGIIRGKGGIKKTAYISLEKRKRRKRST